MQYDEAEYIDQEI